MYNTLVTLPPQELLDDCPNPAVSNRDTVTNGDLARRIMQLREAIAQCTIDKQNLRAWRDKTQRDNAPTLGQPMLQVP